VARHELDHDSSFPDDDSGSPWDFQDPREDRSRSPYHDDLSGELVDEAVKTLVIDRCPMGLHDPAPTLAVLVTLATEVDERIRETVADARDFGYTWPEIAARIALTPRSAQRRYAADVKRRLEERPLLLDWHAHELNNDDRPRCCPRRANPRPTKEV
jgi:hypothetical protein